MNNRPKCPSCNAPNPVSRGESWKCKVCGRYFIKITRAIKKSGDRPSCPACNEPSPSSHGHSWICGKCGKQWVKHRHPKPVTPYEERPSCPHCDAKRSIIDGVNKYQCGECGKYFCVNTAKNINSQVPFVIHHI